MGDRLTVQEGRVLDLLAEGLSNRQIGDRLHLTEKTVKNYVSSVLDKLGVRGRTEAAVYRVRRGSRAEQAGDRPAPRAGR